MINFDGNLIILISTITITILIAFLWIFIRLKKSKQNHAQSNFIQQKKINFTISSKDIKAIAGDNVISTQIDLARAYLEVGKTSLAKKILKHVIERGNEQQITAAKYLLNTSEKSEA